MVSWSLIVISFHMLIQFNCDVRARRASKATLVPMEAKQTHNVDIGSRPDPQWHTRMLSLEVLYSFRSPPFFHSLCICFSCRLFPPFTYFFPSANTHLDRMFIVMHMNINRKHKSGCALGMQGLQVK